MLIPIADFIGKVSDRRSSIALFSVFIFVLFGLIDATVDKLAVEANIDPDIQTTVQAAFVGLAASAIAAVLLTARRERRKLVLEEIQRVMELNHRIRNSLQVITYAQYCEPDEVHREMMLEAVRSMDATLRQLFPTLGIERRSHERHELIHSER